MSEVLIVAVAVVLTGAAVWFFFGPKKTDRADLADGAVEFVAGTSGTFGFACGMNMHRAFGVPPRLHFPRTSQSRPPNRWSKSEPTTTWRTS